MNLSHFLRLRPNVLRSVVAQIVQLLLRTNPSFKRFPETESDQNKAVSVTNRFESICNKRSPECALAAAGMLIVGSGLKTASYLSERRKIDCQRQRLVGVFTLYYFPSHISKDFCTVHRRRSTS